MTITDPLDQLVIEPGTVAVGRDTVALAVEQLRRIGNLPDDAKVTTAQRSLSLSIAASLGDLIGVDVPITGDDEPAPPRPLARRCVGCGDVTSGRWCPDCFDESHDHHEPWEAA